MSTRISMNVCDCLLGLTWEKFYRFSFLQKESTFQAACYLEDSLPLLRNAYQSSPQLQWPEPEADHPPLYYFMPLAGYHDSTMG